MTDISLSIVIGGISFELRGDAFVINLLRDRLTCFVGNSGKTDVVMEIHTISEGDLRLPPLEDAEKKQLSRFISPPFIGPGVLSIPAIIPKREDTYQVSANNTQDCFDLPLLRAERVRESLAACYDHAEHVALALHLFSITIRDYQTSTAYLFYDIACRDIIKEFAPDELFRRLFVSFFPLFSAVLIHSSCLVRNNRAALFLAPDEGGKSTTVKMAIDNLVDCTIPGDDRIVVKKQGNDFFAFGYPWGSITNPSCSAKISAVFLLKKANCFNLQKIDSNTLVEYLWHEHRYDRFFLTSKLKSVVFELLVDFCRQIAAYQMDFPKDYVDWDAVIAVMEGHFE